MPFLSVSETKFFLYAVFLFLLGEFSYITLMSMALGSLATAEEVVKKGVEGGSGIFASVLYPTSLFILDLIGLCFLVPIIDGGFSMEWICFISAIGIPVEKNSMRTLLLTIF